MKKEQITGRIDQAVGAVKEATGKLVGNEQLQAEGVLEKNLGKVEAQAGDIAAKVERQAGKAQNQAQDLADKAQDKAEELADKAGDLYDKAKAKAGELADKAKDAIKKAGN